MHHSRFFFNHRHSSSPTPFPNPTSFRFPPPHPFSSSPLTLSSIKSSSLPSPLPSPSPKDPASQKPQNVFSRLLQTLNPFSSPLFEPIYVVIAAIAVILIQFNPATTTSQIAPPPAESATVTSEKPSDNAIEEKPINIPDDADADTLRSYVEVNVRARKLDEAIKGVNRLIDLKPNEFDLHLLKAHLHSHNGEPKLAKNVFEIALKLEPFNVEAYRGLLMVTSELNESMEGLLKRIEEVVKFFEEEKRDSEAREFKLLMAQVKVMDEDYSGALKVYEEIVKEEPRDFRPYLCQGVVYTLLRKNDEAEKQFEEYRKLVPENHPYRGYFEIFSEKIERGGMGAKG